MRKITPCLWFDGEAEEAMHFYVSVFPDSKTGRISRNTPSTPGDTGSVLTVEFELSGTPFIGLNGGPHFKFNEAVSFTWYCDTQAEIDSYWERLSEGGATSQCGWLKDRFGVSWQIVPSIIPDLISGDPARAERVMKAVMQMTRLDIAALEAAAAG